MFLSNCTRIEKAVSRDDKPESQDLLRGRQPSVSSIYAYKSFCLIHGS
jgi:hypothetical protein